MPKPKSFYTRIYMYLHNKRILLSRHAMIQAKQRGIYPDILYNAINTGKVRRFGKRYYKIIKKYKKSSIVCIAEDCGAYIVIKTVERK